MKRRFAHRFSKPSRAVALSLGLASLAVFALAAVAVRAQDAGRSVPALPWPGAPIDPNAPVVPHAPGTPDIPVAPIDPNVPSAPGTPPIGPPLPPPVVPPLPPPLVLDADAAVAPSDLDAGVPSIVVPSAADAGSSGDAATSDADAGATRPAAPEIPLLAADRAPRVEATVNPRSVKTGALTKLVIRVTARPNEEVTVPPGLRFEGPLEVRARRSSTEQRGERVVHTFELDLQPMAPGVMNLAPIDLRVVLEDGTVGRVQTAALSIDVVSVIGNEPNAQPKPDFPPRSSPQPSWLPGWILGSLMVLASVVMLTLLGARYLGGREKPPPPPPPPRPAWDVALEKLAKIRASSMLSEGRVKEYVDGTTDALREYLGGRFGFDGLESTTDEIVARLKRRFGTSANAVTLLQQIRVLLSDGDLVKFAKVEPSHEHCSSMLDEAVRLVRTTTPIASGGTPALGALPTRDVGTDAPPDRGATETSAAVRTEHAERTEPDPAKAVVDPPASPDPAPTAAPAASPDPAPTAAPAASPDPAPTAAIVESLPHAVRPASFSTITSTAVAPIAPPPIALDDEAAAVGPDDRRSGDDS